MEITTELERNRERIGDVHDKVRGNMADIPRAWWAGAREIHAPVDDTSFGFEIIQGTP